MPTNANEKYDGKTCKASGWGDLEYCKEPPCSRPDVLQQVETTCISNQECVQSDRYTGYSRKVSRRVITKNMICAGNMLYGGADACQGDSGGRWKHLLFFVDSNNKKNFLYIIVSSH